MKKVFLLILATMVFGITFGQINGVTSPDILREFPGNGTSLIMQPATVSHIPTLETSTWVLPDNGGTSQNSRAPSNYWKYQRTEYLITATEMAASGFTSGLGIQTIGFWVSAAGVGTLSGTFNLYLKNTTDATYTLGANWTTAGFSQVGSNASMSVQVNPNGYFISFTTPTAFTYNGGGVYVAWEFSSPSGTIGTTPVTHACNYGTLSLLYGNRSASALPTALTASTFRPATFFSTAASFTDVLNVTNIYSFGKLARPYSFPSAVGVRVANTSASSATFNLTLEVRKLSGDTLRFTSTQNNITLAAATAAVYNFTGWSANNSEDVYIEAIASPAAGETWLDNNSSYILSTISGSGVSVQYGAPSVQINYGFTYPGTGIFANKFMMNGSGLVSSAKLLIANPSTGIPTGNVISAVVINSAGTIVATSANYTIVASDLGTWKSFTFPTPPMFTNENYYVGMLTTAGTAQYYPMGLFYEIPTRGNISYSFAATGGTPSVMASNYIFGIDAYLSPFEGIVNPTNFASTPSSANQIDLSWTLNGSGQPVMVAYNTTNTFGTPVDGTTYSPGNTLTGGGTIIYNGTGTTFNHSGLNPMTTYYYKAWSVNTTTAYSSGVLTNATTPDVNSITVYPFNTTYGTGYVSNLTVTKKGPWINASTSGLDTLGRGYLKFDLTGVPSNAFITKATVKYYNFYQSSTSSVANNIYPLTNDPITATGQALYNDCGDGPVLWNGTWAVASPTWFSSVLNSTGISYISDQVAAGWAGFGIVRGSTSVYRFSGYNDATYKPVLQLEYHIPTSPVFSAEPTSNDFEGINLGIQSLPKVFTIKNRGIGTITIDFLVLEGTDASQFILTDNATYPKTLGAGQSYTVSVVFKPTSTGSKTANLRAYENENDHFISLTGYGYLNGPRSLTASAALYSSVDLAWDSPLPLEEIRYDDNTSEANYWVGSPSDSLHRYSTRITAPVSGTITNFGLLARADAATTFKKIGIYPELNGGPNLAAPIQVYSNIAVTSTTGKWLLFSLTTPLSVTPGQNYYIVAQWPFGSTVGPYILTDTHNDHYRCNWSGNNGLTWSSASYNLFMRAYMSVAGDASNQGPIELVSGIPVSGSELLPTFTADGEISAGNMPVQSVNVPGVTVTEASGKSLSNYTFHRGTVRTALTTSIPGVSGNAYNDNTTAPSTTYYYMLSAQYTNGAANSDTVSVTTWAACSAPTALTATNITQVSASLSWNAGTGTSWVLDWGPAGFNHIGGTLVSTGVTNPYALSGLTTGVSYDFYVRTNCGSGNLSPWAGPFTFTTLSQPVGISGTATNASCFGQCNGAITTTTTGGSQPYTYIWSDGATTANRTGLCAGSYSVTVTDATNGTSTGSWMITEPALLAAASVTAVNPLCSGGQNGSISVVVTGGTSPYTYLWNTGATTSTISGLGAGSYYLTVTDANNCSSLVQSSLANPSAIVVNGTVSNTLCSGSCDGSIIPDVAGGTSPYTYAWSGPDGFTSSSHELNGLCAGIYYLTVTDWNACTSYQSFEVYSPASISLNGTVTNATCPGAADGSIASSAQGGTPPYTYLWSNGATTDNLSGVSAGTYSVTVTDNNQCTGIGSWTVGVTNPVCAAISVNGIVSSTVCYNATSVITVAGGSSTFIVNAPGFATFIAGSKISFLPGTKVNTGGYLLGKIAPNGPWCSNTKESEAAVTENPAPVSDMINFSIFPNPTNGNFTLVQKGDRIYDNVIVEIYTINGRKVTSVNIIGEKQHEFSTAELSSGLYFVKVKADSYVETLKLVKTR